AWSTALSWLLVLTAIPLGLKLSDTWPLVSQRAREFSEVVGAPRAVVFAVLVVSWLIAATWKQLGQRLYIGLTGGAWLSKGSVFLILTVVSLLGPAFEWLSDHRDVRVALINWLPLILAALVAAKMTSAAWIITRLERSSLLTDRAMIRGAAYWMVA